MSDSRVDELLTAMFDDLGNGTTAKLEAVWQNLDCEREKIYQRRYRGKKALRLAQAKAMAALETGRSLRRFTLVLPTPMRASATGAWHQAFAIRPPQLASNVVAMS
jgi:hypothetical protein